MAFFFTKPNINPLSISTPVMVIDAETGVVPGTPNAALTSLTNQAAASGGGGSAGQYSTGVKYRGINRAGAEYGDFWDNTGSGWDGTTFYTIPDSTTWGNELTYLKGKGFNSVRIPFSWERCQHSLNGPLNTIYFNALTAMISQATTAGFNVVIDCHNYGRYATGTHTSDQGTTQQGGYVQHLLGDGTLTFAHLGDLWTKIATTFASYPANLICYNLMNEPHDLPITSTTFFSGAQVVINAIRTVDAIHMILVPNTRASDVDHWSSYSPGDIVLGSGNGGPLDSVAALAITDSANNYAFDMHAYFENSAGQWSSDTDNVTNWAITNNKKLWGSEIGIHNDNASGSSIVSTYLTKLNTGGSVWVGWNEWNLPPQNITVSGNYLADGNAMPWYTAFLTPNIVSAGGGGGGGLPLTAGNGPTWKPADEKAGLLHSLAFSQAAGQEMFFQTAAALSAGASHFATVKYTATDAAAANVGNAPLTLFGYNGAPQIWSAGFSAGTAQYNYGSGGGGGGGSSVPSNPIPAGSYPINSAFMLTDSITDDWFFVPPSYDVTHNTPIKLFIYLHGCFSSALADNYTGSPTTGSGDDWICMTPAGTGSTEGGCWDTVTGNEIVTDRIMVAVNYAKSRFNINPTQVYIGGYSSGGDLTYQVIFRHSDVFAGAVTMNTDPFRDNHWGGSSSAAFAANNANPLGWKFNIAHLLHTSDENYTRAPTLTDFGLCSSAGYPVTLSELPGTHADANSWADWRGWFGHNMALGWHAPAGTPASITSYNSNATNINDGKSHTVCWTHSTAGVLKVYVDGVLSNSWSGVTYNTGALINIIGGGYNNVDCFDGSVAEAFSYNGVLTDQNVRDLHSRATYKWF